MALANGPPTCSRSDDWFPVNRKLNIGRFLNPAAALLLTALILCLSMVGSSPDLHKRIHADASAENHVCAITLFAKERISPADPAPILIFFVSDFVVIRPVENFTGASVLDLRLSPGRAPPAC